VHAFIKGSFWNHAACHAAASGMPGMASGENPMHAGTTHHVGTVIAYSLMQRRVCAITGATMTDKRINDEAEQSNMQKEPDDWVTGDEPMTGAQKSYLKTLCEEAREPFDERLTKAQASKRIDELQEVAGRGKRDDA
jgi:hypothetical protein